MSASQTSSQSSRQSPWLAALPLCAAFLAAPLAVLAGKLAGKAGVFRQFGPQGLALWLVLAALAVLFCLVKNAQERKQLERPAWPAAALALVLAACAYVCLRLFGPAVAQATSLAALLDELRLPALALFAGLWAWTFGAPTRGVLARLGAALGTLVLFDFLLTAVMARRLVLGGGYLFGEGVGTADALAFLLCLGLCATLDQPKDRTQEGPQDRLRDRTDAPQPLLRWLILAGLLATFSRSGLAAGALICLALDRSPFRERLAVACACALGIWVTLTLPLPRMANSGEDLGLFWYWSATLQALAQDPRAWLMGLPLDSPVALAMPDFQGVEWEAETEGLPVSVFEIPVSGLRLLAGWGAGAPLAVFGAALYCALRGKTRFGLGLVLALAVCASLTPVLHTPATVVALALALIVAARRPADGPPPAGPAAGPDAAGTSA